jgi:hypothetical protein
MNLSKTSRLIQTLYFKRLFYLSMSHNDYYFDQRDFERNNSLLIFVLEGVQMLLFNTFNYLKWT